MEGKKKKKKGVGRRRREGEKGGKGGRRGGKGGEGKKTEGKGRKRGESGEKGAGMGRESGEGVGGQPSFKDARGGAEGRGGLRADGSAGAEAVTVHLPAGLPAGGAGGPPAGVRPGEGAGLRRAAAAVAEHPLRPAAALPRLPAATGGCGCGCGAAGQPCRGEARGRRPDANACAVAGRRGRGGEPRPVRREQGPGADGGVEKLLQFGIGGFWGVASCSPLPGLSC